jgi:hypothetical protein
MTFFGGLAGRMKALEQSTALDQAEHGTFLMQFGSPVVFLSVRY